MVLAGVRHIGLPLFILSRFKRDMDDIAYEWVWWSGCATLDLVDRNLRKGVSDINPVTDDGDRRSSPNDERYM